MKENPYVRTVAINLILSIVVIIIAVATGSSVGRAVVALGIAFVVSTLYSSWRIKQRSAAGTTGSSGDGSGRGNG